MIFIKRGGSMKKVNKFKYKRVRLYWQDIVSNPEWLTLAKAKDQMYSWCELKQLENTHNVGTSATK